MKDEVGHFKKHIVKKMARPPEDGGGRAKRRRAVGMVAGQFPPKEGWLRGREYFNPKTHRLANSIAGRIALRVQLARYVFRCPQFFRLSTQLFDLQDKQ